MNAFGEQERIHRYIQRELEAQAEQLKVRRVIARGADGIDRPLEIIQTVTDDGITVYVRGATIDKAMAAIDGGTEIQS